MNDFSISKRLEAICSLIPQGAKLIDVGTDHAYVPLFLLKNGIVDHIWASDINLGPLKCALENAAAHGMSDSLTLYQSDGLDSCHCYDNFYNNIIIAGMGGEMICDIILRSKYVRDHCPRLILQPMTMQPYLRKTLGDNGFDIIKEVIVFEDGKYYLIFECEYCDNPSILSEFEIAFGKGIINKISEADKLSIDYLNHQRVVMTRIADGKLRGNMDNTYEEKMIAMIDDLID